MDEPTKEETKTDNKGRLTENLQDFYLSADAEGNAILLDAIFRSDSASVDEGYIYHSTPTVRIRNSEILSPRSSNDIDLIPISGTP